MFKELSALYKITIILSWGVFGYHLSTFFVALRRWVRNSLSYDSVDYSIIRYSDKGWFLFSLIALLVYAVVFLTFISPSSAQGFTSRSESCPMVFRARAARPILAGRAGSTRMKVMVMVVFQTGQQ